MRGKPKFRLLSELPKVKLVCKKFNKLNARKSKYTKIYSLENEVEARRYAVKNGMVITKQL